jgi:hypothetical protein
MQKESSNPPPPPSSSSSTTPLPQLKPLSSPVPCTPEALNYFASDYSKYIENQQLLNQQV